LLGLPLELRFGQTHGDDGGQPFLGVVLGDRVVTVPKQSGGAQLVVDDAHQGTFEAVHVRTALGGGDDVDKRTDRRVVTSPPPQRDVDVKAPVHVGGDHVSVVVQDGHVLDEVSGALEKQDVADRHVRNQVFTE